MAGSIVSNYSSGNVDLTALMTATTTQRKGYHAVTLTNMDNTSVPQITAGSAIEIDNSLYEFQALESITGSAVSGTNYIKLIPLGASVTAAWTQDMPAFDDDKQGWYSQASGEDNYRYLQYKVEYDGASEYGKTYWFQQKTNKTFILARKTSSTTSSTSVSLSPIIFNGEIYDVNNEYNNSTGVVTILRPGFYEISGTVACGGINLTSASVDIQINGASTQVLSHGATSSTGLNSVGLPFCFATFLNSGDIIEVDAMAGAPGNVTIAGASSYYVTFLNVKEL